jgi:hypothetical protein
VPLPQGRPSRSRYCCPPRWRHCPTPTGRASQLQVPRALEGGVEGRIRPKRAAAVEPLGPRTWACRHSGSPPLASARGESASQSAPGGHGIFMQYIGRRRSPATGSPVVGALVAARRAAPRAAPREAAPAPLAAAAAGPLRLQDKRGRRQPEPAFVRSRGLGQRMVSGNAWHSLGQRMASRRMPRPCYVRPQALSTAAAMPAAPAAALGLFTDFSPAEQVCVAWPAPPSAAAM